MKNNIGLKHCPFCGGEAAPYKRNEVGIGICYSVFCTKCCYETQYSRTEKEAISDWNRRAEE